MFFCLGRDRSQVSSYGCAPAFLGMQGRQCSLGTLLLYSAWSISLWLPSHSEGLLHSLVHCQGTHQYGVLIISSLPHSRFFVEHIQCTVWSGYIFGFRFNLFFLTLSSLKYGSHICKSHVVTSVKHFGSITNVNLIIHSLTIIFTPSPPSFGEFSICFMWSSLHLLPCAPWMLQDLFWRLLHITVLSSKETVAQIHILTASLQQVGKFH